MLALVDFHWLSRRAREIATETLLEEVESELEIERMWVAGAVVVRAGLHYRIESGDESAFELEAQARSLQGLCACGALLSSSGARARCRGCGREYRQS